MYNLGFTVQIVLLYTPNNNITLTGTKEILVLVLHAELNWYSKPTYQWTKRC